MAARLTLCATAVKRPERKWKCARCFIICQRVENFFRSENTESRNVEHQIHLQAIGHPRIAFTLLRDDRLVFQLPETTTLSDRIRDLYGSELLERLIQVNGNGSEPYKSRIRSLRVAVSGS